MEIPGGLGGGGLSKGVLCISKEGYGYFLELHSYKQKRFHCNMVEKMPSAKTKHLQNDLGGQWKMSHKSLYFVNPSQIPSIVFVPWLMVFFFSYTLPGIFCCIQLHSIKIGLDSL